MNTKPLVTPGEPAFNLLFGTVWVNVKPAEQYLQTVFPDGLILPARPEPTDSYGGMAYSLGYLGKGYRRSEALWYCCSEHEIYHTVLSQMLGEPYSPTLHYAACQLRDKPLPDVPTWKRELEESTVLACQAAMNGADWLPHEGAALTRFMELMRLGLPELKEAVRARIKAASAVADSWEQAKGRFKVLPAGRRSGMGFLPAEILSAAKAPQDLPPLTPAEMARAFNRFDPRKFR
jgi:hypothetical protein